MDVITLIKISAVTAALAILSWCLTFIKLPKVMDLVVAVGEKSIGSDEITNLRKRLEALSLPISAEVFAACRLSVTILTVVLGSVFITSNPFKGLMFFVLAVLFWRLPNRILSLMEKRRKEAMEKGFPLMVNQVRIFSKASDHYQALKIVPYALNGPLKKEMQILSAELELTDIEEALQNFARRCGFYQARDFAQVLLLAIRTGVDIDEILANYSKTTHKKRVNQLKRWIKIQPILASVLPALMLFVFVSMFLVPLYTNIISKLQSIN